MRGFLQERKCVFMPSLEPGDAKAHVSITEKKAWEIALREEYCPHAKFESYLQELVDAGFLRRPTRTYEGGVSNRKVPQRF